MLLEMFTHEAARALLDCFPEHVGALSDEDLFVFPIACSGRIWNNKSSVTAPPQSRLQTKPGALDLIRDIPCLGPLREAFNMSTRVSRNHR